MPVLGNGDRFDLGSGGFCSCLGLEELVGCRLCQGHLPG